MILIQTFEDLLYNLKTLEHYLFEGSEEDYIFGTGLIKRGICFLAYQVGDDYFFAPSRFIGYAKNTQRKHLNSGGNGGQTNKVIEKIIGSTPEPNRDLEKLYQGFCAKINISSNKTGSHGNPRKFWLLDSRELGTDFFQGFEEGQLSLKMHFLRERNPKVVQVAKGNFLKKHGRIFCEACGFDFFEVYGDLGKNFIEGHHIEPLSKRVKNEVTNPEDIVLLCSNCHRMVHRLSRQIGRSDLDSILKK